MGLLEGGERARLIELLLRLPNSDRQGVRRSLVAGLPDMLRHSIEDTGIPSAHIASIVDTADGDVWSELPDGSWSVIRVIENAIFLVRGSLVERDLNTLLETLKNRALGRAAPASSPGPARLAGDQLAKLLEALLSAFPQESALQRLLRFRLDTNLSTVAGGSNLRDTAFSLLQWAEASGRIYANWELVATHHALHDAAGHPDAGGVPITAIAARPAVQRLLGT